MSDLLFPHSSAHPRALRLRLAALGVAGCVALGVVAAALGLQTLGVVSDDVRVRVELATVGDSLGVNSDVKYQGLRVGRVIAVDPSPSEDGEGWDGPHAEVLVAPEHADLIPAAVRARVLPGTLFGNDYVDLAVPAGAPRTVVPTAADSVDGATDAHLTDGDVVPADTSDDTLRLMDTFSATQRLLAAVDPAQWDVALSQLAGALDGRGASLAEMIRDGGAMLGRWHDLYPQARRDIELLARSSDLFADVEPQLVNAIRDSRPLARTLVEEADGTAELLAGVPDLLEGDDGVTAFLRDNGADTARLLNATAANLEVFADRYPSFALLLTRVPELLENGARAAANGRVKMEGVLGLQLIDAYGPEDCPTYRGLRGRCGGAQ